jgi:hypothetical protein
LKGEWRAHGRDKNILKYFIGTTEGERYKNRLK